MRVINTHCQHGSFKILPPSVRSFQWGCFSSLLPSWLLYVSLKSDIKVLSLLKKKKKKKKNLQILNHTLPSLHLPSLPYTYVFKGPVGPRNLVFVSFYIQSSSDFFVVLKGKGIKVNHCLWVKALGVHEILRGPVSCCWPRSNFFLSLSNWAWESHFSALLFITYVAGPLWTH